MEHRNADTLKRLQETEKALKVRSMRRGAAQWGHRSGGQQRAPVTLMSRRWRRLRSITSAVGCKNCRAAAPADACTCTRPLLSLPLHPQAQQEESYVDMALCEEEREKGNTAFKEARFPEAVAHYQEAIKR